MIDLEKTLDHVLSAIAAFDEAREDMDQQERYDTVKIRSDLYSVERRIKKAMASKSR